MKKSTIITLNGPAGAGKGTLASRLAGQLGLPHLDCGLIFRKFVWDMLRGPDQPSTGLADSWFRCEEIGLMAAMHAIWTPGWVRLAVDLCRVTAAECPLGFVADGRDAWQIFNMEEAVHVLVTADEEVRLKRRAAQLTEELKASAQAAAMVRERQRLDNVRIVALPRWAAMVDTTNQTLEQSLSDLLGQITGLVN